MAELFKRQIEYLSPAAAVNMGDHWFAVARLNHFWIERRFQVLRKMAAETRWSGLVAAEIGCGNGLLQRQCEDAFGIRVDGFDLNEAALAQNIARRSLVACYNVFDRLPELRERYDIIFLFDVIEHIEDHAAFVAATLFHLKPGGQLIVNVPANQDLFSEYDLAAGHVRRYHPAELRTLLEAAGLKTKAWTYWGFGMVPFLVARRWFLKGKTDPDEILRDGFNPGSALINALLRGISRMELIPQHRSGSSLMFVAVKQATAPSSSGHER